MEYGHAILLGPIDARYLQQAGKIVIETPAAAEHLLALGDSAGGALRNVGVVVNQPTIAFGDLALANAVDPGGGSGLVAIGFRAMEANTVGTNSLAIGHLALVDWQGLAGSGGHIFFGNAAGLAVTGGIRTTVIGNQALQAHLAPNQLNVFGFAAFQAMTTGSRSIGIGDGVASSLTTITESVLAGTGLGGTASGAILQAVVIGDAALASRAGVVDLGTGSVYIGRAVGGLGVGALGDENTVVGANTALTLGLADRSTIVGSGAGAALTTGDDNSFYGRNAGNTTTTGSRNLIFGSGYTTPAAATDDYLSIADAIFGDLSAAKRIRFGGAGVIAAGQVERVAVTQTSADTTPVFSIETTGANAGQCKLHVGDQDPSGVVSANAGHLYVRDDGVDSAVYVNISAADPGTDWEDLSSGGPAFLVQAQIPNPGDDTGSGFALGDQIYSTAAQKLYTAVDVTNSAAIWIETPGGWAAHHRRWQTVNLAATTSTFGTSVAATAGTVSTPQLVTGTLRGSLPRNVYTSAAGANSNAATLQAVLVTGTIFRGNAAGRGGFHVRFTFAVSSSTANQRCFLGLWDSVAVFGGSQDPDALTNAIGAGWRSADGNLQIFHNDAAGTVTAVDLGASLPANTPDAVYDVQIYAAPDGDSVYYLVVRLDAAGFAFGELATNLPSDTTWLAFHGGANNGGTAAAVVLEIMRVGIDAP